MVANRLHGFPNYIMKCIACVKQLASLRMRRNRGVPLNGIHNGQLMSLSGETALTERGNFNFTAADHLSGWAQYGGCRYLALIKQLKHQLSGTGRHWRMAIVWACWRSSLYQRFSQEEGSVIAHSAVVKIIQNLRVMAVLRRYYGHATVWKTQGVRWYLR